MIVANSGIYSLKLSGYVQLNQYLSFGNQAWARCHVICAPSTGRRPIRRIKEDVGIVTSSYVASSMRITSYPGPWVERTMRIIWSLHAPIAIAAGKTYPSRSSTGGTACHLDARGSTAMAARASTKSHPGTASIA